VAGVKMASLKTVCQTLFITTILVVCEAFPTQLASSRGKLNFGTISRYPSRPSRAPRAALSHRRNAVNFGEIQSVAKEAFQSSGIVLSVVPFHS
jgi:hypothetical protein